MLEAAKSARARSWPRLSSSPSTAVPGYSEFNGLCLGRRGPRGPAPSASKRQLDAAGRDAIPLGTNEDQAHPDLALAARRSRSPALIRHTQAELKMKNRTCMRLGMVFAKEWEGPTDAEGRPRAAARLRWGEARFQALVKAAGVRLDC